MVITMKKTAVFFMVILLMIGACSCVKKEANNGSVVNAMVAYVNEKYPEDEFYYKAPTGGGAGVSQKTIIVSSKNYPNNDIYIRYSIIDEHEVYSDNYLSVKYAEQTKSIVYKSFSRVFLNDFYLFYQPDNYACPNNSGNFSFEEYISSKDSNIGFVVIVNDTANHRNSIERELEKILVDSGMCIRATIYFDDSNDLGSLTTENLYSYIFKKQYKDAFSFEMASAAGFSKSRWE